MTDTTDVLARIDFALSVQDYNPAPSLEWMPGDPLPRDDGRLNGLWLRPMFEVIDDHTDPARCEPCQVSWDGSDPCWVCGQEPEGRMVARLAPRDVRPFTIRDLAPYERVLRQAAEALARVDFTSIEAAIGAYDRRHPAPLPINGREYARRRRSR